MIATSVYARAVQPGEYERECQWRRRTHKIKEGDSVTIRTTYSFDGVMNVYDIKCLVAEVHKHFVVLSYPQGFLVSFQWRDFEQMRLKEE